MTKLDATTEVSPGEGTHASGLSPDHHADAETLSRIAHVLATELDLHALLQKIIDAATHATGAEFGALYDTAAPGEADSLRLCSLSGAPPDAFEQLGTRSDMPLFAPTFRGEGPVRLADLRADPRHGGRPPHAGAADDHHPIRSYLAVPVLTRRGEVLGGLFLGHAHPGVFTERAERLALAIAAHASMAIENATLYQSARREAEQRPNANAALDESDRRLRTALEAAGMGVWEWDLASGQVVWSPGLVPSRGMEPEGFTRTVENALAEIRPEDRPAVEAAIRATVEQGADFAVEYRARAPSGQERWLEARGRVFRGRSGAPERVIGTCTDVTERKRIEQALRESESRFIGFMQHLPGLAWIKDADGRYLYVNGTAAQALGVREEAILGKTDAEVFPPEMAAAFRANDADVLETGAATRTVESFGRPEGVRHSVVSKFPIPVDAGQPVMIGGIAIDITDRVRSEQARALLAAIVESSDDAIISEGRDGIVTSWNAGAARIFGYAAEDAVGKPINILVPEDRIGEEGDIFRRLEAGERIEHYETVRVTRDGRRIDVAITASPLCDDSGKMIGASKIARDITGAKLAAAALRESENRYRHLLGSLPIAVYTCDAAGRITLYNEAAEALWGRAPRVGVDLWTGAWRMFTPDGAPLPRESAPMAATLRAGVAAPVTEMIYERPDGTRRHVLSHPRPEFDAEGTLVGATNALVDITDRKRAEDALRESERHARALLGSLPQLVWTCTPDGKCDFVSQRWLAYTGSSEADQLGSGWTTSLHPDDRAVARRAWLAASTAAAGGEDAVYEVEYRLRRHDGEYRWFACRASPLRDAAGNVQLWVGASADIQSIKDAETAVRESEERFRTMADSAPVLIWIADGGNRRTWFNRPWLEFTGRTMEQECGAGWFEGVHPDDQERCADAYTSALGRRRPFRIQYRLRRCDGEYRWVLDHGVPLLTPAGAFTGLLGSCVDVTDEVAARTALEHQQAALEEAVRQRAEQLEESHRRLRLSERMASIGTLSAGLGHDMANILLPIRLRLDALDRVASEQVRTELREIRSSVEYLQNLSSGLRMLVVDPAERTGADTTELGTWWTQASTVLKSAVPSRVTLACELPPEECWVHFTATALTQVVFNLVQNSIDALHAQGRGHIEVRAACQDGSVVLSVTDDGPGMEPDVRERCTQPFFTTKARAMSTGLGLALVYGMVQEAGGSLEIESAPGRGTTVRVCLKPATPARRAKPAAALAALVDVKSARIRAIVAAELHDLGFRIVTNPRNCGAALKVVDAPPSAHSESEPDAVILDLEAVSSPGNLELNITELRRRVREAASSAIHAVQDGTGAPTRTGDGGRA